MWEYTHVIINTCKLDKPSYRFIVAIASPSYTSGFRSLLIQTSSECDRLPGNKLANRSPSYLININ